jgi:hypothetical protein
MAHWVIYAIVCPSVICYIGCPFWIIPIVTTYEHSAQYHFVTSIYWWLQVALSVFAVTKYNSKQQIVQIG